MDVDLKDFNQKDFNEAMRLVGGYIASEENRLLQVKKLKKGLELAGPAFELLKDHETLAATLLQEIHDAEARIMQCKETLTALNTDLAETQHQHDMLRDARATLERDLETEKQAIRAHYRNERERWLAEEQSKRQQQLTALDKQIDTKMQEYETVCKDLELILNELKTAQAELDSVQALWNSIVQKVKG